MSVWQFSPHPVAPERSFRGPAGPGVAEALRSAHGLGAAFDIEWCTGRSPALRIHAPHPVAARWVAQVLTGAYSGGAWATVQMARGQDGPRRRRFFGRRLGPLGAPLPDDEPWPWVEAVLPALRAFPAGLSCHWRLRPAGLPLPSDLSLGTGNPTYLGPGLHSPPATEAFRQQEDRRERDRRAPRWTAQVWLEADEHSVRTGDVDRWQRLLASATTRPGAARLAFRPPLALFAARPPMMVVTEREIAGLLPSPRSTFTPGPGAASHLGPFLTIGRDPTGASVRVPLDAAEGRHAVILGETGMGKSSLVVALALAASHYGNVVLFDPIGDTGKAVLVRLPPERYSDVQWVSPSQSPQAIDLLEPLRAADRSEVQRDRALGDLVTALRRVRAGRYAEGGFWGPRIEETLRRTLAATAAIPTAGLSDTVSLLSNALRRPVGIPPEARAAVEALQVQVRERPEEVDGTRRLLAELTERPVLRDLLGCRDASFRVRDEFLPHRITVVSGDAASIGESAARYLLAVHLALMWSERLASPGAPKTFVFLDEAQWYAHESVAEILRLGRRENLHLILATQGLSALSEEVRDSVRTNVADLIAFRGSPEDARELARIAPWIGMDRWMAQPRGHAIVLLGKGAEVHEIRRDRAPDLSREEERARIDRLVRATEAEGTAHGAPARAEESVAPFGPEAGATARWILLAIWGERVTDPANDAVHVSLEALRRAFDGNGEVLRRLGGELQRRGALLRTFRDPGGNRWAIAAHELSELVGSSVDPHELAEATRRYRSAVSEGGRGPT